MSTLPQNPRNPFRFGSPVEKEFYVKRDDFRRLISEFLVNNQSVVLLGPRRYGKTSFILDLQRYLIEQDMKVLFVDVFNITSHKDFLQQLLNALKEHLPWFQKILNTLFDSIKKLIPTVGISYLESKVEFSLGKVSEEDTKALILETLKSLSTIKPKLFIAIDEFQKVGQLEDEHWLESTLRSHMQSTQNVVYLFSGSRHSAIHAMFSDPGRAFYRSCQVMAFPTLGDTFTSWIIARFKMVEILATKEVVTYLRGLVLDTPNYVQMVCFHIVTLGEIVVTKEIVDQTLDLIVSQNAYAYQTLLTSLSPVQQRVLRMAAIEGESVFSKENLQHYDINSPAHVSQAIITLKSKQILDEGTGRGRVIFDDPLFAIWLRKTFLH